MNNDQRFLLLVALAVLAPVIHASEVSITSQPITIGVAGQVYQYDVDAISSEPGDVITYSLRKKPAGMTVHPTTGVIRWIPALSGTFEVEVRAQGESSGSGSGHDDQRFWLSILDGQPSSVSGSVRDQSGTPVPHSRLRLFQVASGHFVFSTRSDSVGQYRFPHVNPGTYFLRIAPPENSTLGAQWYDRVRRIQDATPIVVPESSHVTIHVILTPRDSANALFRVSGTVMSSAGQPVNRARVEFFRVRHHQSLDNSGMNFEGLDDDDRHEHLERVLLTDSLGNFSALLKPRTYIIRATKEGFEAQFWDHKPSPLEADRLRLRSDTSGIDFDLGPSTPHTGQINGAISSALTGHPVQAHVLGLHRTSPNGQFTGFVRIALTDSAGLYGLPELRSGYYIVLALPQGMFLPTFYDSAGGTPQLENAQPVFVDGSTVNSINIQVRPDTVRGMNRINGTVTSAGGPIPGALILARTDPNGSFVGAAVSGMDGGYSIAGVAPGSYTLLAQKPDYMPVSTTAFSLQYVGGLPTTTTRDVVLLSSSGVSDGWVGGPATFTLHQNYPNPFNPATTIQFDLRQAGMVTLQVFDVLGRHVATLVDQHMVSGSHSMEWNATGVPSGVYWYRLKVDGTLEARKMMLVR